MKHARKADYSMYDNEIMILDAKYWKATRSLAATR